MKQTLMGSAFLLILAVMFRWELYDGRHAGIALLFAYASFYGWRRVSNKAVWSGADTIDENTEDGTKTMNDAIWGICYLFAVLFLWSPYYLEQVPK
jgi:hypothetical protein